MVEGLWSRVTVTKWPAEQDSEPGNVSLYPARLPPVHPSPKSRPHSLQTQLSSPALEKEAEGLPHKPARKTQVGKAP